MKCKAFDYVGNKCAIVDHYRALPSGVTRVVEPFAGSMAYGLHQLSKNQSLQVVGYEINPELVTLWNWLNVVTDEELDQLEAWFNTLEWHEDIRKYKGIIPDSWSIFVRLNAGSLFTGNLSKNIIYNVEKPIGRTLGNLRQCIQLIRLDNFQIIDASSIDGYVPKEGDAVFCDPPYMQSGVTYVSGKDDDYDFVSRMMTSDVPTCFTYDEHCYDVFPEFEWHQVKKKRKMKRNGDRWEMAAYNTHW